LDVGCARGGLLDALSRRGYIHITGLDPSQVCVEAVRANGHHAIRGVLDGHIQGTFDFITLSHVLEHIDDVRGFLRSVLDHLEPSGRVYIEVPDASRHADYSLPFLEFNSEHVNHFCRKTLVDTLDRNGFLVVDAEEKVLALANNVSYPVVWAVAERKTSVKAMMQYVAQSRVDMEKLNAHLEKELGDAEECIIWGAGEYLCHVTSLAVFRHVKVVQIVDRNPAFQGKPAAGRIVEDPSHIRRSCPIVIAALTAAVPSIKADIAKMNLKNKTITLEFK
jgi:SAM-dependent methyltransferase